jgi:hypothetical protein
VGKLRERDHLEDLTLNGKMILKWIFKEWDGDVDWIDLAQDRWRAVVKTVINRRVPSNAGNFLASRRPVSFYRRITLQRVSL